MVVHKEPLSDDIGTLAGPAGAITDELASGIDVSGRSFCEDFVLTHELDGLAERSLRYLDARIPIHFRGRAGCGKTALALYLAHELGGGVYFLSGDAMRTTESLVGQETGMKTRHVVDRYVHSVRKVEQETSIHWQADVLTQAALGGGTLVYDEFTRSPAEANNALLSVLEEGILMLPAAAGKGSFAPVHEDFRVIFTSNSAEYAGVQAPQDALIDRMITFDLDDLSAQTETAIVSHRSGIASVLAQRLVALVRAARETGAFHQVPTMRASLMMAQVVQRGGLSVSAEDPTFCELVLDILASKGRRADGATCIKSLRADLSDLIAHHCPAPKRRARA
ncbi:MAG: gas vesicle protein GvpN [Pseudomonadota bacterium]